MHVRTLASAVGFIAACSAQTLGQCTTIDFESLAANAVISTQFSGVTFSRGSGSPPIARAAAAGNTSSGVRALITADIGAEFECSYLVMSFSNPQSLVQFSAGVWQGCNASDRVRVRSFDAAGTSLGVIDVANPYTGVAGRVLTPVSVGAANGPRNISRVEVEYGVSPSCACAFEMIDDLQFDFPPQSPVAVMTTPGNCSVVTGPLVTVRGTVGGAAGTGWALQYAGGASSSWQTIATGTSSITDGVLGIWNISGLSDCAYALRLKASTPAPLVCGGPVVTESVVTVNIDTCRADFNNSGTVSVQDIFDFLNAYFAGCP